MSAPLRPNAVDTFDGRNTGGNVGRRIPWIEWDLVPRSDELTVTLYLAGGGCSLPGMARVFPPLEGWEAITRFVFERVATLGVNACPPLVVGIGVAGSADMAAKLSKKALLRPLGSRNAHPRGAELEARIARGLDAIGIGPGGLGGRRSVLGVHLEEAARHPAALAAGLSLSCWAHRRALVRIGPDLRFQVLSHRGFPA
jgi:L(+)-tartrate dehydratase alpha subunit